jgi:hypothetical protein
VFGSGPDRKQLFLPRPDLPKSKQSVRCAVGLCGHIMCVCVYASRACACVIVYMCALQRAGMRAPGCGFGMCCVVCRVRVRVSCAVQKHLKVMHACILLQHSASLFIQLRTRMIHPCSSWVATSAPAKFAGVGHVGLGAKDPTLLMLLRGAEQLLAGHGQLMQEVVSDPKRTGALICWYCVHSSLPRSTPRFLTRQSEIDLDGNVLLSV